MFVVELVNQRKISHTRQRFQQIKNEKSLHPIQYNPIIHTIRIGIAWCSTATAFARSRTRARVYYRF
jgi:hypothetical protein